jgi:hypothetical protein
MADFNMGLLGDLFGGGTSPLSEYLTPQQQEAMSRQALMSTAAALLQAGGPSSTPISLGQALGAGLQAGTGTYGKAQEGAIQQLMVRQKLDEAKRAQAAQENWKKYILGQPGQTQPITPDQALAMPGMPVGPTVERAELIGQPGPSVTTDNRSALTPEMRQLLAGLPADKGITEAMKFMQPPEVIGEPYRTAEGKTFQRLKTGGRIEIPTGEAPAPEVIGEPKEVTDAAGNPVLIQRYKDGSVKTIEGFGVPREMVQMNLNNKIVWVDKNRIPANAEYLTGLSPAEAERLRLERAQLGISLDRLQLSRAEFDRGQYDRVETADGFAYVPKVPGLPIIPIAGAGGEQLTGKGASTEDQAKSAGFSLRMNQAKQIFNQPLIDPLTQQPVVDMNGKQLTLENVFGTPSRTQSILRGIPSAGLTTGIANFLESGGRQQYRQAQENWVTANLRAESGAVIGTDEMEKEIKKYFPQSDDKPQTITQKADARRSAELAMQVRGGPALKAIQKAQQATQPSAGLSWDPATQSFK